MNGSPDPMIPETAVELTNNAEVKTGKTVFTFLKIEPRSAPKTEKPVIKVPPEEVDEEVEVCDPEGRGDCASHSPNPLVARPELPSFVLAQVIFEADGNQGNGCVFGCVDHDGKGVVATV